MNDTLLAMGAVAAMVWPATELLGRAFKTRGPMWLRDKNMLAVVMGIGMGLIVHGSGKAGLDPGVWGWAGAAMMGLFATAGAVAAHDTVKVAKKKVGG